MDAGDIVVADSDGVVVVPRARAAEVLAEAQEMDFKEHSMYAYIEKLKSIVEAVKSSASFGTTAWWCAHGALDVLNGTATRTRIKLKACSDESRN